jgi:molybdate transport system substrate-binding protein
MPSRRAFLHAAAAALFAPRALRAAAPVRVAAASDLRFALEALQAPFAAAGHPFTPTFAASGALAAQITQGAPFDLFLAADPRHPRALADTGHADATTLAVYARGHLVLWLPAQSPLPATATLATLATPAVRRVAIANPRHAPYGQAAEAALRAAGLWDAVSPKLVLGDNVAQAAQFVQSGAADAGLVARSLARAPALASAGRAIELPAVPPLEQTGVVLRAAADPAAAAAVLAALRAPAAQATLATFGFSPPPG